MDWIDNNTNHHPPITTATPVVNDTTKNCIIIDTIDNEHDNSANTTNGQQLNLPSSSSYSDNSSSSIDQLGGIKDNITTDKSVSPDTPIMFPSSLSNVSPTVVVADRTSTNPDTETAKDDANRAENDATDDEIIDEAALLEQYYRDNNMIPNNDSNGSDMEIDDIDLFIENAVTMDDVICYENPPMETTTFTARSSTSSSTIPMLSTTSLATTATISSASSTTIKEQLLLHQPYHGRQPSIITEETIITDDIDNDRMEQEESWKYSGMDVLQRITSQQEFLGATNAPTVTSTTTGTATANSIITTSSTTATNNYEIKEENVLVDSNDNSSKDNTNRLSRNKNSFLDVTTFLDSTEENKNNETTESSLLSTIASSSLVVSPIATTGMIFDNEMNSSSKYSQDPVNLTRIQSNNAHDDNGDASILIQQPPPPRVFTESNTKATSSSYNDLPVFLPYYTSTMYFQWMTKKFGLLPHYYYSSDNTNGTTSTTAANNTATKITNDNVPVTYISFYALLLVTCSNHILTPLRDAIILSKVGVQFIPNLTFISTILAIFSSVPIGWLFEAPDPCRRVLLKQIGLTRGETQGTSLALFYRIFAFVLILYAIGFCCIDIIIQYINNDSNNSSIVEQPQLERRNLLELSAAASSSSTSEDENYISNNAIATEIVSLWSIISQWFYIAFFLIVHLMKLHCISLVWGVVTEALEYEEESMTLNNNAPNVSDDNSDNDDDANRSNSSVIQSMEQRQQQNLETHNNSKDKINVTTRNKMAMDNNKSNTTTNNNSSSCNQKMRLQRLSLIGFGGTMGGIIGSILASILSNVLKLPGLLVLAAFLLEISAELSIELGRIMQKHWMEQQVQFISNQQQQQQGSGIDKNELNNDQHSNTPSNSNNIIGPNSDVNSNSYNCRQSCSNNITTEQQPLDSSIKRSVSLGSMKRVASGNSLHRVNSGASLNRVRSTSDLGDGNNLNTTGMGSSNTNILSTTTQTLAATADHEDAQVGHDKQDVHIQQPTATEGEQHQVNDDTFRQRLMRGVYTIFRSRLLMAIFTYNALYASTTVLLSFQRAALVASRTNTNSSSSSTSSASVQADTSFLANINMASSIAIFALQATGIGAYVAHACGPQGTLSLMPIIRLLGVLALAYWHRVSDGQPPNLLAFLVVDEFCKIMNLAIAKPVRESLWRGLSNEARYEAKPIVDTLANRWGGGSAAFLAAFVDRTLRAMNNHNLQGIKQQESFQPEIFGFPPILFLCIIIATWWAIVSADLGQIRKNIDIELKKRQ